MADRTLDFAIYLRAIDQLSPKLQAVGRAMGALREAGEKLTAMGEQLTIRGALMKEGAEKLYGAFESIIEAGGELNSIIADTAAVTALNSEALESLREHAEAFSESSAGMSASAEQYVGAFGKAYAATHNLAEAQKTTDDAVASASATGIDYNSTLALMISTHDTLGVSSEQVRNALSATQRQFAVSKESGDQLTMMLARMSPAALQSGGDLSELLAIGGQAEEMFGAGRGVMMLSRMVEQLPEIAHKGHLRLAGGALGILDQIQARIRGLNGTQQLDVLKRLGIESGEAGNIILLLQKIDRLHAGAQAIRGDTGQAFSAEEIARGQSYDAVVAKLSHTWTNFKAILGTSVLPRLIEVMDWLQKVIGRMSEFATAHPALLRWAVGIAGVVVAMVSFAGVVLSAVGALLIFGGVVAPILATAGGLVALFGWLAAAVGVAAYAAYVLYRSWGPMKAFFVGIAQWFVDNWPALYSILSSPFSAALGAIKRFFPGFYAAGVQLLKSLAAGIESAVLYPVHAIEGVASSIGKYIIGHSPPPEGPLRNLVRPRIVESLAEGIRPGAAVAAVRRVAAATAMIAPLAIAAPMVSPAMAAMAPTFQVAAAYREPAADRREAAAGPVAITINFNPQISVSGGESAEPRALAQEILHVLKSYTPELDRVFQRRVEQVLARKDRKSYSRYD